MPIGCVKKKRKRKVLKKGKKTDKNLTTPHASHTTPLILIRPEKPKLVIKIKLQLE